MKRIVLLLLGASLSVGAFTPVSSQAAGITIEIGDRPFYSHGPSYWHHGHRLVWVPGHWARRHHHHRMWIHGHYVRR